MEKKILKTFFDIEPDSAFQEGAAIRYWENDTLYTLIQVTHMPQEMLVELYQMSEHLKKEGDRYVATFYPSKNNTFLVTQDDIDFVVLKKEQNRSKAKRKIGRQLAKFHLRGRSLNAKITERNRMGQWKMLWEKRLEQMESMWRSIIQSQPENPFTMLFAESFPYYMGLSENAIQYLVDTELDEEPTFADGGTICHERFTHESWSTPSQMRNPFDWVYDHCGRDIAEWIRDVYLRRSQTFEPEIHTFLNNYQKLSPLSPFSWRLIYARLLFPFHYYECIEEYFRTNQEEKQKHLEERLHFYIKYSQEYERFLNQFKTFTGVVKIPEIHWLNASWS